MDSVTDMVFLCHPRMYYFIDQYDFQWLSHVFSFGLYHHRRQKNDNTCCLLVEEHRSLGGSIISRLDNGAFVG